MLLNLADYEAEATRILAPEIAAFLAEGAGSSRTVRRNLDAFQGILLSPRRFVDVGTISTSTTVLGRNISWRQRMPRRSTTTVASTPTR